MDCLPSETRPASSSGHEGNAAGTTIGDYLVRRLLDHGIRDVFGIPGDYVLSFYALMENSPLQLVGCTREDFAGFAADAYARINGLGAVCVTYCVGGLSLATRSPGPMPRNRRWWSSAAPGLRERFKNPLLHHKVKDFRTQFDVFRRLCVAAADLADPAMAFREIDRVLEAVVRYAGRAISSCPATSWATCPAGITLRPPAPRPAIRRCWPKRWPKRRGGSRPAAAR